MSERLPRPVRLLLGATSFGAGDRRLRGAVSGKVVLVTGASSGVGKPTAMRLGAAGATVLLVARRAELLEEVSNTGLSIRRWISESYERFRDVERTINVNYLGPARLLLGLLPSMRGWSPRRLGELQAT